MARYEDKFLIPLSLLSEVENFFDSDHVNFYKPYHSRVVNSIYYDTDNLAYARQNSDGNGLRSKIRVRFYDTDFTSSQLEVKYKRFSVGKKLVLPFCLRDQIPGSQSLCKELYCYPELEVEELRLLSSKVFVKYNRKYWSSRSSQGVRITLDASIFAKEITDGSSLDSIFNYNVPFQDICVLEIKYDSQQDISSFKEYLQGYLQLRRSRFSKYVLGLIFTSQISMI